MNGLTDFHSLVTSIQETNFTLRQSTSKAINRSLTIRNWLIGFHIVEFEQNGEDRAKYGQRLTEELAKALDTAGLSVRSLKLSRQFYFTYPPIGQTLSAQFKNMPSIKLNDLPGKLDKVADIIKSPFTFEFLGLKAKDVVYENDLEQALVDNLEAFLIELGHGFCFVAKQKRITIGDEYFFVDLVFYHRILKCHVLIELKTNEVKHEHIGRLKTYINYYKKEIMARDDNPPVGLLLVTDQNRALVEYAVADSDMQLFVSKYVVNLPSKEQLQEFIRNELAQMQS